MNERSVAVLNTSLLYNVFRYVCRTRSCFRIFVVIARDANPEDNMYFGTLRQIAERANISKSAASRAMKLLCEKGVVDKIANSVWRLNTNIIVLQKDARYKKFMQDFESPTECLRTD